jgi:hypothetical protein
VRIVLFNTVCLEKPEGTASKIKQNNAIIIIMGVGDDVASLTRLFENAA